MADSHDVCIIGKDLVRNRIDEITLPITQARAERVLRGIARKVEADEVLLVERLAVDGVLAGVLVEPGADDLDVEDGS
jgi:hypothetical protein